MTTFNTGNAIGSTAVKDLYDNAENLDHLTNDRTTRAYADRLGVSRKSWYGMEQDFQDFLLNSGYEDKGDYAAGIILTARNQFVWKDGELYRIGDAQAVPYTTTGDWASESGKFVAIGDRVLRQQLASAGSGKGAALVGADDGASGALFTTVQGFITRLLSYVNFKWSTLTDSTPTDPSSALKLRAVTAGRRGEIQVVPNDGDGTNVAGQRDQNAGGEVTIMGYDVNGALGFSNNIATTLRYMRIAGVCQSVDLMTFKTGSQTDVPIRFGNDAKGYTVQISEVTGKFIASFGVRSGDGIGDFPQANPLPAFAASGDQPAYDFEERPTAGGAIINQWRIRLIDGNLDIQNLTDSKVQFQILASGHVLMPNLGTINTDSGANKPNAYIDPSTGELKRATYTKLNISGAAVDAATTQTLVNQLRTVIINYGLAQ